eukprot:CAMPEP_0173379260 /NCGR_PEP_ID=MMETSP1356-20130122/2284_1 /TAXON_ID=77927 ORGANISM="Hemiselmis virescens, Strain PCC157" /NCGR_SAMPLE_ID=MMETSP1356 /ASSEMBLY_ACC=CAM_ASM_000847 /LENGTH=146 /DNA_ID=CAMNT_0014332571 /DNA_START=9 /DNA_END=449 /DNA_ORIENTATION=+
MKAGTALALLAAYLALSAPCAASHSVPAFATVAGITNLKLRSPAAMTPLRMSGGGVASSDKIIVKSPTDAEKASAQGWPTWGCEVSKFPWSYDQNETCLLITGEVTVTPNGGEPVEIKAGDMATFPAGMSCTWDVKKTLSKHYNFF